jgi:hypothetical protein
MTESAPHARAFDLPGWPCPPRVRDIPHHQDSWGWARTSPYGDTGVVAQDELGYLWADGQAVPQFRLPDNNYVNPGAVLFWTETGLGAYVHPQSLQHLRSVSRLDMDPDRWVPIAVVSAEIPPSAKTAGP